MTRGARYAPSTSGRGTSHSSAGAYFNNQFWGGGEGICVPTASGTGVCIHTTPQQPVLCDPLRAPCSSCVACVCVCAGTGRCQPMCMRSRAGSIR